MQTYPDWIIISDKASIWRKASHKIECLVLAFTCIMALSMWMGKCMCRVLENKTISLSLLASTHGRNLEKCAEASSSDQTVHPWPNHPWPNHSSVTKPLICDQTVHMLSNQSFHLWQNSSSMTKLFTHDQVWPNCSPVTKPYNRDHDE